MITKVSSCILYDESGREVITKVSSCILYDESGRAMITKVSSCILYDESGRAMITKVSSCILLPHPMSIYLVAHHHGNWVSFLILESETQKSLVYTHLEVSEDAR